MPTIDQMYDEAIDLEQNGGLEEAVGKLQELLQRDPNYALAHSALSVFFGKLEDFDKGIEHAAKVCELEPDDSFSFVGLSLICQKAGRLTEAENAMMQARQVQIAAQQEPPG